MLGNYCTKFSFSRTLNLIKKLLRQFQLRQIFEIVEKS